MSSHGTIVRLNDLSPGSNDPLWDQGKQCGARKHPNKDVIELMDRQGRFDQGSRDQLDVT
jgi:hypothetical protein